MNNFGKTLFGGSRFIRWSLTPFLLLTAVLMPLASQKAQSGGLLILAGLEVVLLGLLAGFWLPARIGRWCFRVVTGLVFAACLAFMIADFSSSSRTRSKSPIHAVPAFLFIGLPSLWYTLSGRFSLRPEKTEEELAAEMALERAAFETALRQPEWAFYERHLRRPIPGALRELYADERLITATLLDYSDTCSINSFFPLNESSLCETPENSGQWVVPVAISDVGDAVYLKPGHDEADAVYMTCHDGGDTEMLADSVSGFVEHLRQANMERADH